MKRNIVVNRISFTFVRQVPPTGLVYKNKKGDEAVFSYNKIKRHLFGNINTNDGREYEIESCHNGHVLKEIDVKNLGSESPKMPRFAQTQSPKIDATEDTTTIVTFSVMFYYTQEFEAGTADIEGFVDQIIELTSPTRDSSIARFLSELDHFALRRPVSQTPLGTSKHLQE